MWFNERMSYPWEWSEPLRRWNDEFMIHTRRSVDRRIRFKRHRRKVRLLGGVAVAGAGLLAYYCTLPIPYEKWYIGITGVLLVLPFLIARGERIR